MSDKIKKIIFITIVILILITFVIPLAMGY